MRPNGITSMTRSAHWLVRVIVCLGLLIAAGQVWAQAPDPDLNNDGVVNILDVSIVSSCFGQDPATNPQCQVADTDGDGDVDLEDLSFVTASFGQSGFPTEEEDMIPPVVTITGPANLSFLDASPLVVSGTVDDETATVEVNGVSATPPGSADPRLDINGDGVINVNDARICVLRCTNPICAP